MFAWPYLVQFPFDSSQFPAVPLTPMDHYSRSGRRLPDTVFFVCGCAAMAGESSAQTHKRKRHEFEEVSSPDFAKKWKVGWLVKAPTGMGCQLCADLLEAQTRKELPKQLSRSVLNHPGFRCASRKLLLFRALFKAS